VLSLFLTDPVAALENQLSVSKSELASDEKIWEREHLVATIGEIGGGG
jgi:hypothetical protein